jgi:hypothetical protein
LGAKINLAAGCAGRGEKRRERKREIYKLSADRNVCFHLIYYKVEFCGHSPRERVNHVYLVVLYDSFCVLFFSDLLLNAL